jgi:aryl-alcohol dehydrogenase-like predicted oxidoreductase
MNERTGQSIFEGIELGVGAWAWGDRLMWGYGREYSLGDLRAAFETSLAAKIRMFDTAETYGQGQSEQILGSFLKAVQQPIFVATKFMPFPWRLSRSALRKALDASLRRLGLPAVDLYQIHMPLPPVNIETWMGAMAEVFHAGLVSAVGISNYDTDQMQTAYDRLIKEGVHLASNQVEYSLLNRKIEKNGLLQRCEELGVKVIAYSPLGMGVLTGKYTPDSPPSGTRGRRFNRRFLEKIQPLLNLLRRIGTDHGGKTPAQVALNWAICKGTLPIPGAKTMLQAEQNAGAIGWKMTESEVDELDSMSDSVFNGGN